MKAISAAAIAFGMLICMSLMSGCSTTADQITTGVQQETTISPADQSLIRGLYYAGMGSVEKGYYLKPGAFLPVDQQGKPLPEDDPIYAYRKRGIKYVHAHEALMSNKEFAAAFAKLERYAILEILPGRPSAFAAQQKLYEKMVDNGMAKALYEHVGSSPVTQIPDGLDIEVEDPFIVAKDSIIGVPDSIAPFHCCGGNLVITELGDPYSQYIKAHRALLREDPVYKTDYLEIIAPFERATQVLDIFNPEDAIRCKSEITDSWRTALQQPINTRSSIQQRIEEAAQESSIVSQDRR